MNKLYCVALAFFLFVAGGRLWAKDAIPETRFRVIYKDTGKPIEWAAIMIECFREFGWFHADEEKTYDAFFYVKAPDGWVTIPGVEAPGTNAYEITVWVPGCIFIINPDPKWGSRSAHPFNNKTLPRFLKRSPAERVFYVTPENINGGSGRLTSWGGLPYEGLRYEIAQRAIDLDRWPKLSGCYAGWYFEDPRHLQERRTKEGPYFKKEYCKEISGFLDWAHDEVTHFGKYAKERHKYPPEEVDAKVNEVNDLVRDLICSDIQKKKEQWGGLKLAKDVVEDPLLQGCEALKSVQVIEGKCDGVSP